MKEKKKKKKKQISIIPMERKASGISRQNVKHSNSTSRSEQARPRSKSMRSSPKERNAVECCTHPIVPPGIRFIYNSRGIPADGEQIKQKRRQRDETAQRNATQRRRSLSTVSSPP